MTPEALESKLLRLSKEAFDLACTLSSDLRIEVYLEGGIPKKSDPLSPTEAILYRGDRKLCYQIFGHDYLEPEITAWIESALGQENPQPLETAIQETAQTLAGAKGCAVTALHPNEVFAHLNVGQLEQIEHAILDYWWQGNYPQNGKALAHASIQEALGY